MIPVRNDHGYKGMLPQAVTGPVEAVIGEARYIRINPHAGIMGVKGPHSG